MSSPKLEKRQDEDSFSERVVRPASELAQAMGIEFHRLELLEKALVHRSFRSPSLSSAAVSVEDNEVLEFLGDAVVALVVAQGLCESFQSDREGTLSKKRAQVVSEQGLSRLAKDLGLHEFVQISRSEYLSHGELRPRLLASALEAVVGAVFQDQGYEVCRRWLWSWVAPRLEDLLQNEDFKSRLQEHVQQEGRPSPVYQVVGESGLPHDKDFSVEVLVSDAVWGRGQGKSKKLAEQAAAREALEKFLQHNPNLASDGKEPQSGDPQ